MHAGTECWGAVESTLWYNAYRKGARNTIDDAVCPNNVSAFVYEFEAAGARKRARLSEPHQLRKAYSRLCAGHKCEDDQECAVNSRTLKRGKNDVYECG